MKVYLDDERPTPEGWVGARYPSEVIAMLEEGNVEELSLDHDLGFNVNVCGYDVLVWLEEAVATRGFVPPRRIWIHTANPSARTKMKLAVQKIFELHQQNTKHKGKMKK